MQLRTANSKRESQPIRANSKGLEHSEGWATHASCVCLVTSPAFLPADCARLWQRKPALDRATPRDPRRMLPSVASVQAVGSPTLAGDHHTTCVQPHKGASNCKVTRCRHSRLKQLLAWGTKHNAPLCAAGGSRLNALDQGRDVLLDAAHHVLLLLHLRPQVLRWFSLTVTQRLCHDVRPPRPPTVVAVQCPSSIAEKCQRKRHTMQWESGEAEEEEDGAGRRAMHVSGTIATLRAGHAGSMAQMVAM